ncbi:hypothetical protein HGRIS_006588 [Hohenbuehelia grisea]|uniref:Transposase n=1 Tax=Hohenbuehelia grisea TaxID=104357 RepID=A0ABR3J9H1_9AGAR
MVTIDPPDNILKESLTTYAKRGLNRQQKIQRLKEDHGLAISVAMLGKIERRLDIPSVRRSAHAVEVIRQAITDEVSKDLGQRNGPNYVQSKMRLTKDIFAPWYNNSAPRKQHKPTQLPLNSDIVRRVMHEEFPEGFERRFPGKVKPTIPRGTLTALGPFHEVSADGHEKIDAKALQMGDVGIPIYGYKDKWTSTGLFVTAIPNCRLAGAIGHLHLDFLEKIGGFPLQLTVDGGSETGWIYVFQTALREAYAPNIDPNVYLPFVTVKSVHNTVIEGFWRWLRDKTGISLKDYLVQGKKERWFIPVVELHRKVRNLFNWMFPPLVQRELDDFCHWWNHHRIRPQPEKEMPSGHVPIDVLEHPTLYGGINCLIPVPHDVLQELRAFLTEEVGPREIFMTWVPEEFATKAEEVHEALGLPPITLENAWGIFQRLSEGFETM